MRCVVARACALTLAATAFAQDAVPLIEKDWQRHEQTTFKREWNDPAALDGLLVRGAALLDGVRQAGGREAADKAAAAVQEIVMQRDLLVAKKTPAGEPWGKLYLKARGAVRALMFAHPAVDFDQLLFVTRRQPRIRHQCSHRVGEAQLPDSNLCVLEGLGPDGKLRKLLSGEMAAGGIGRPDLSFDGKRVAFPHARKREIPTKYGFGIPGHRGGDCHMFDLYEIGVDGSGLRQLTDKPESEDTEPCYLPGERIGFMSSRADRYVQCGDWALACGLYSMAADGGDARRITEPKEGEFFPSMLSDGRILYTRWDYTQKPYNSIQQLWAVNPDGVRAQLVYGDHYRFSAGPITFWEPRQIPGTHKIVSIGAAHHNTGAGPVIIVDMDQNRGGPDGMKCLTPEIHYPEAAGENGKSPTGWYQSAYPLSEDLFLVCYTYDLEDAKAAFGLYLLDRHGNRELIYPGTEMESCFGPMPLRARPEPRVIPDTLSGVDPATPGVLNVTNVYEGLPGVKYGSVKHLRVLETYSKTMHTIPQRVDVGAGSGWDIRAILGTVPVEEDGSVHFEAPPYKQIFFAALDENYLEIQRMRNFMNVMPGERTSCIGCHEPHNAAAWTPTGTTMALKRPPSKITPPPWGTEGFSFVRNVQPILDKHCIECHDGQQGNENGQQGNENGQQGNENGQQSNEKSFDLRGKRMVTAPASGGDFDQGPQHAVSDSFLALLPHVSYVAVNGYRGIYSLCEPTAQEHTRRKIYGVLPLQPRTIGSGNSALMEELAKGHGEVKLTPAEWRTLAAWIDTNAQFLGSWEDVVIGKRHGEALTQRPLRKATQTDLATAQSRRKEIEQGLADGQRLVAHLNCGVGRDSGGKEPQIVFTTSRGYHHVAVEPREGVGPCQQDMLAGDFELRFGLSGLDPTKQYELGVSWWDHDASGRVQRIEALLPGNQYMPLTAEIRLQPDPKMIVLPIPQEAVVDGKASIGLIRLGAEAVLASELWLIEKLR